ncbi:hypothetical protein EI555_003958, partial [Monodon monoceros]
VSALSSPGKMENLIFMELKYQLHEVSSVKWAASTFGPLQKSRLGEHELEILRKLLENLIPEERISTFGGQMKKHKQKKEYRYYIFIAVIVRKEEERKRWQNKRALICWKNGNTSDAFKEAGSHVNYCHKLRTTTMHIIEINIMISNVKFEMCIYRKIIATSKLIMYTMNDKNRQANPSLRKYQSMCGAFGKPQGTVARVHVAQVIMSIHTKLQNKEHVAKALHRAKFQFPGHQKIHISKKWGFTKFHADEFENMVAEKWLITDGCGGACPATLQRARASPDCGGSGQFPTNRGPGEFVSNDCGFEEDTSISKISKGLNVKDEGALMVAGYHKVKSKTYMVNDIEDNSDMEQNRNYLIQESERFTISKMKDNIDTDMDSEHLTVSNLLSDLQVTNHLNVHFTIYKKRIMVSNHMKVFLKVTEGVLLRPKRINHANSSKGGENKVAVKVLVPTDLQDQKETPTRAEENFVRSRGSQGWRTSASSSSSRGCTAHRPIFGPSRARTGSGAPDALQRPTSRERGGNGAGRAPAIGRRLTRRAAECTVRLPALACLRACPSPTSGIVCSTPTYLRSRLPLRVEAHAGLLAGTRKRAVKFGSGPETGGGDAGSLADGRRSPLPPLGYPSALSFPIQLTVAISKESFVFYLIEKVEANSVKVFELPSLPIPIAPMKDQSTSRSGCKPFYQRVGQARVRKAALSERPPETPVEPPPGQETRE